MRRCSKRHFWERRASLLHESNLSSPHPIIPKAFNRHIKYIKFHVHGGAYCHRAIVSAVNICVLEKQPLQLVRRREGPIVYFLPICTVVSLSFLSGKLEDCGTPTSGISLQDQGKFSPSQCKAQKSGTVLGFPPHGLAPARPRPKGGEGEGGRSGLPWEWEGQRYHPSCGSESSTGFRQNAGSCLMHQAVCSPPSSKTSEVMKFLNI